MNLMVFCMSFVAYKGGGWDKWWGKWMRWEVAKNLGLNTPGLAMTHTMTHVTLVGHRGSGTILGTHHLIDILNWCHYSSCNFGESAKCPLGKQTS